MNGIHVYATNEDIIHIGLSVADGSMQYDALLEWVRQHTM